MAELDASSWPPRYKGSFFKPSRGPERKPAERTLAKPTPKVVEKVAKERAIAGLDRREKEKVRTRDKEACRVCGGKTRDVHERVFKSRGGVASLENSLCACRRICHRLLQQHGIQVWGESCNGPLIFKMSKQAAHLVFRGKAHPKHVEIV